jgi:hypothetical protein
MLVIVGYSLPPDDALIRFFIRQFAEEQEDGHGKVVFYKRDYHADVWTAAEGQLERFYTPDPDAGGFGVYAVFWFGDKRPSKISAPPGGKAKPRSAAEMEQMLIDLVPPERRARIAVRVIDVSGLVPPTVKLKRSPAKRNPKAKRKPKKASKGRKRRPAANKSPKKIASKTKKRPPSKAVKKKKGAKKKPAPKPRGRNR